MKTIYTTWSDVKSFIDSRSISAQYIETSNSYHIVVIDGGFSLETSIKKTTPSNPDQTEFESTYKSLSNKNLDNKTSSNITKVSIYEAEGDFSTKVSHDFTKKSTWYQESLSKIGETLTLDTGLIYKGTKQFWINLTNGLHYGEDTLESTYPIKVYDNGVEQASGYTIDHDAGKITFATAPTGPVTADYHYADKSTFSVIPPTGKVVSIVHAELDFSKNAIISKVHFDIYAYDPDNLPNKMLVERMTYNNMRDILKVANDVTIVPAIGALTQDVIRAVFMYGRIIQLKSSQGIEMRITIDSEEPFTGEMGSISMYTVEEVE